MENARVSKALHTIAVLLEIKGDNPFKIRSYENASRIIDKLNEPVSTLLHDGRLRAMEGIGEALENKITEFITTGEIAFLKKLLETYPATILDMLDVEGVGVKSIKVLYDSLGICSLESLHQACIENRVATLPGFSLNSERKFMASIEFLEKQRGYFRINIAWQTAALLRARLLEHSPATEVEIAGSVRRFSERIHNINLVAAATDAISVMKCFVTSPETESVVIAEQTAGTIITRSGIPAHLKIVPPMQFPHALLFATGNQSHLAKLQELATAQDVNISEAGMIKKDGKTIICNDESEIYSALNLPFMHPELREGLHEFEITHDKPLVTRADILGLVHCHSTWSDGLNSISEMANTAHQMGYQYIVLTDHSQSSVHVNGLSPDRVEQQHGEINEINDLDLSGFRIVKGIEVDILNDGSLDYDEDVLRTFEFIIASIHSNFDMKEEEATSRIIRAIENPYTSAIGHLTGRLLLTRKGYTVDVNKVVDAAVSNGVAFEINANPRRLDMDWRHLHKAADKGAKFVIGPDAHRIAGIHNVRYGIGVARKGALTPEHILNCLPVEKFVQWRKP